MIRLVMGICLLLACSRGEEAKRDELRPSAVRGTWRGVLSSPGGPLPFALRIDGTEQEPPAVILGGAERAPVSRLAIDGRDLRLDFEQHGARIEAEVAPTGDRMSGAWRKGGAFLEFNATRGAARRFVEKPNRRAAFDEVAGAWKVALTGGDRRGEGALELAQEGREVRGTLALGGRLYRGLEGAFEGGLLRLSMFDGGEALLLRARARNDGTLLGDFWSGAEEHAIWRAERPE